MGVLDGVKVVEFAGIGPEPMACMLLADMGANVCGLTARLTLARHHRTIQHVASWADSVDLKHPDGSKPH